MIVKMESGRKRYFATPVEAAKWCLKHLESPVEVVADFHWEANAIDFEKVYEDLFKVENAIESLRTQRR